MGSCSASTVALNNDKQQEKEKKLENGSGVAASASGSGVEKSVVSEVFHRQRLLNLMVLKSNSFSHLTKHVPVTFLDKVAYWLLRSSDTPLIYSFRAMMLETVATVPGMVGGMLLHCKLLRRFKQSGGWINSLLEKAENERMHLMTFMEVAKTKWYERALVFAVQGVFFNAYFVTYILSPKLAHRIVGYLEEEDIHSYTKLLKELGNANIENVPAPAIAIDYWHLPKDSTLCDAVVVVWAD
ncbi:Ubiquinol oxidase 2, mitochondrial [Capsicum chinense]|nr:Ubiquinol oxidase 2, mitochondrial [Capsicum chinense]